MRQIITKVDRERGYTYLVDKEGNVVKESYNWFKDRWTLITLLIILLSGIYYFQMQSVMTQEKNFVPSCNLYQRLVKAWDVTYPDEPLPDLEILMSFSIDNLGKINRGNTLGKINLSGI